ncbi:hypothetical protein [Marinobacter sp.]|uniref:hypothetical protein n=1 Tax=Marinobacter sp. TaxID=50741 RepID=UPI0026190009|nr:hypothetical protein [Marinobacter sp.]
MKKLNNYLKKKALMDQLARELNALEDDQAVQKDMAFRDKLLRLMDDYGISAKDTAQLMGFQD